MTQDIYFNFQSPLEQAGYLRMILIVMQRFYIALCDKDSKLASKKYL